MKMKKEERKNHIEKEALSIAKEVLNDRENVIIAGLNEMVPKKIVEGYEKCLLRKYNIKTLKLEGHEYVRIYVLASFSESKQNQIMEDAKELIPAIEAERIRVLEEQKMLRRLHEEAFNSFAHNFLKWLFDDGDDQNDDDGAHDEKDNMSAN